eukprot:503334_1
MTEETEQQTKQLKDHVQSTQSTEDLLLLIKHFPLDSLKAFASKQIANEILNPNQISKIYHTILPINDLLPDAILQQILSFDNLYHPRLVCRQWHALSIQNETNYMHEIYQTININDFPKDGKNWVVHPKRKYLHQVEKDLGFKGPINCTDYSGENGFEALIHTLCDDGDRLLLHNGQYWKYAGTSITKSLIFIGLGNKVKFYKDPTDGGSNLISVPYSDGPKIHVHFENIIFDCDKKKKNCIYLINNSLSVKNCTFVSSGIGIKMMAGADLTASNCIFLGVHDHDDFEEPDYGFCGIYVISAAAKVDINCCTFKRFWETNAGCVYLDWRYVESDDNVNVSFKCTKNKFERNFAHPILQELNEQRRSTIKSNINENMIIDGYEKKHNSNMIFPIVEGDYDDQCGYGYQYANQHDCRCCD